MGQDVTASAPVPACITSSNRDGGSSGTVVPSHPLGIKPAGNAYTSSTNIRSTIGIFASLPDELIIQVLEYLDSTSLLQLGATCKAFYAFSRLEDLWKALFIGYGRFHCSQLVKAYTTRYFCAVIPCSVKPSGLVSCMCASLLLGQGTCCLTIVAFYSILDDYTGGSRGTST